MQINIRKKYILLCLIKSSVLDKSSFRIKLSVFASFSIFLALIQGLHTDNFFGSCAYSSLPWVRRQPYYVSLQKQIRPPKREFDPLCPSNRYGGSYNLCRTVACSNERVLKFETFSGSPKVAHQKLWTAFKSRKWW